MGMVEELIRDLREDLAGMGVSKDLFQNRFNNAIEDMIRGIFLTSDGELLYPTVETQVAQLLYSTIKSRPFLVGNNSLAVSFFIKFMEINQYLVDEHGDCVLDNSLLLSLVISVAESKPEQQEHVIKSIVEMQMRESYQ